MGRMGDLPGRKVATVKGSTTETWLTTKGAKVVPYATITECVKKRAAAAERFALYQVGMSVEEYVAAGGKRGDIAYDLEHGFITVDHPAEPEASEAAPAPKRSRKGKTASSSALTAATAE